MLLDAFSRFFLRHEVQFRPLRNHGIALPMVSDDDTLDVHSVLQRAIDSGRAEMALHDRDVVSLTLVDVRPDDDLAILLFRRSNPDAATPTFENRQTRKLWLVAKTDDDALAVSCHLFVHLTPVKHDPPTYRAILEEVPGLGRSYIQSLIGEILRGAKYEYTNERKEEKETYTIPTFCGIKSASIGGVAATSAIKYVELVRPGSVEGLDTGGIVAAREEKMQLVLKTQPADPLPLIRRIKEWAIGRGAWSDVRVQITMPEERTRLVSIAREADAADVLFVRSEQIQVPNRMHPCTDVINEDLVRKAIQQFDEIWSH